MVAVTHFALPNLTLAAYYETAEVHDRLAEACGSERMRNVRATITQGGLPRAIEAIGRLARPPQIVVVEVATVDTASMVAGLAKLAEACRGFSRVFLIGPSNDINIYRNLVKYVSVSDYFALPLDMAVFIDSISHDLQQWQIGDKAGKTVLVLGASGGAGASTVASNLAQILASEHNADTALADYKHPFGSIASRFNIETIPAHSEFLYQPSALDAEMVNQLLVRRDERLNILVAAPKLEAFSKVDALPSFEKATNALAATHEFVICDLALTWGRSLEAQLAKADEVVVVLAPDFSSTRNAQQIVIQLEELRPGQDRAHVVLNQVGMAHRQELRASDVAKALGYEINRLITIRHDAKAFSEGERQGQVLAAGNRKHAAVQALRRLAGGIASGQGRDRKEAGRQGLLAGLFGGGK